MHKVVVCVSGPLGLYRVPVIRKIMDPWLHQTFFRQSCTYGDDRHLTNLLLKMGWKVTYTPFSKCLTETPISFFRFFKQQTRWSKSFFRELFWSGQAFHKHSILYGYEMIFHTIYPFVLGFWQMWILWRGSFKQQVIAFAVIFVLGIVKSLVAFIVAKCQTRMLYFMFYLLYYLVLLIPAKLLALATLHHTSWGTRGASSDYLSYAVLGVWNLNLLSGLVYSIYRTFYFWENSDIIYAYVLTGIMASYLTLFFIGKLNGFY